MKQNTHLKILKEAEHCLQLRGYNGFSYKDLANAIGIKTSSIHYYYPTKVELVVAVIAFYMDQFTAELARISHSKKSTTDKLLDFIDTIFAKTFSNKRKMCLGGILAAEMSDLDPKVQTKLQEFFTKIESWIVSTIKDTPRQGSPAKNRKAPETFARQLIVQIEGALILARLFNNNHYLSTIKSFVSTY